MSAVKILPNGHFSCVAPSNCVESRSMRLSIAKSGHKHIAFMLNRCWRKESCQVARLSRLCQKAGRAGVRASAFDRDCPHACRGGPGRVPNEMSADRVLRCFSAPTGALPESEVQTHFDIIEAMTASLSMTAAVAVIDSFRWQLLEQHDRCQCHQGRSYANRRSASAGHDPGQCSVD